MVPEKMRAIALFVGNLNSREKILCGNCGYGEFEEGSAIYRVSQFEFPSLCTPGHDGMLKLTTIACKACNQPLDISISPLGTFAPIKKDDAQTDKPSHHNN